MMVAQQLYEGVELGAEGSAGLITYMRTDSVRLSEDAVADIRGHIAGAFGPEYLPERPNRFKSRKGAQDAHEAIRPTSAALHPDRVSKYLSADQRKIYRLIWERFVACQMTPAVYDQTGVDIRAGRHRLRASGSVLRFPGWLAAISGGSSGNAAGGSSEGGDDTAELPLLSEGDTLELVGRRVICEQKFTGPPPRFTEGTLIRELEERGIGRPSTYAAILSTIQDRRYVAKEDGRLSPSDLGALVTERLVRHFPRILDVDFTAKMEESLDGIEEGKQNWVELLERFYTDFRVDISKALREMKDIREQAEETDRVCERCGKKMVAKWGRNGRFLACSGYPDCRNTAEIDEGHGSDDAALADVECEECGKPMVRKRGRFGEFLACTGYPSCRATRSMPTGIACLAPGCGGELVQRRTKTGRVFYGCSEYEAKGCGFVVWGTPVEGECPRCHASFLVAGSKRRGSRTFKCVSEGCGYSRAES